jgi:transposase-like protein
LSDIKRNWFQMQQSSGRGNKRYSDATIEQARQRVERGESIRGVARDMAMSHQTLHDRLKKWRSKLDDPTDEDFDPDAA